MENQVRLSEQGVLTIHAGPCLSLNPRSLQASRQTTQDSSTFCVRQEPKSLPKSTSCQKLFFPPSNHLNVLHRQIAKKKKQKKKNSSCST